MNAKTRRKVNGYIWNEKLAELHREHDAIREITDEVIRSLDGRPPSVRVIVTYIAQIALHLNAAVAALRELETIAREQGE